MCNLDTLETTLPAESQRGFENGTLGFALTSAYHLVKFDMGFLSSTDCQVIARVWRIA